jgi:hypothetical protein
MSTDIDIRACIEKILPENQLEYDHIHSGEHSDSDKKTLKAAFFTKKLWPKNSKLYIYFMDEPKKISRTSMELMNQSVDDTHKLDPLQEITNNMDIKEAVKKIVTERIDPVVSVKLLFTDNINESNIRITFDPNGGAWSLVGTDCREAPKSEPTMNLGWFDVGTTIHEFCHALGMIHEHQNPRSNTIQWDEQKVYSWAQRTQGWDKETIKTNILDKYSIDQINGSDYDPFSVMLYFFPGTLTKNNIGTRQNFALSPTDVLYLEKMYPGSEQDPDTFYKQAYGHNISEALTLSGMSSNKMNSIGFNISKDNIWYYILIILGVLILIYYLSKNKYKNKYY